VIPELLKAGHKVRDTQPPPS
jgi:nucleoside-diphosphate-sugar epimerase